MTASHRLTALLCGAEVLSMTGFATYAALLPVLRQTWGLTNSEAGLISGAFFGGYMTAVPVLTSLTDRVDARRVYAFGSALAAIGLLGFAALAGGLWPAVLLQMLAGAGLAGTYMPGLKILTDHVDAPRRGRWVAFYTSSFGVGASLSLLLASVASGVGGWRAAFAAAGLGPIAAGLVVSGVVPAAPSPPSGPSGAPTAGFRAVVRARPALACILGYAVHCWELFGFRSWVVAFLTFNRSFQPAGREMPMSAPAFVAGVNLLGPPASILGNELASRLGTARFVRAVMLVSAALACAVGVSGPWPWRWAAAAVCVYFIAIMADSSTLTAAVVAAAPAAHRGATMAVHSFLGFGAGFVAPIVFGVVLDATGGGHAARGWLFACASLGLVSAVGGLTVPAAMREAGR
ncbi:MAG TPA: MFS transporter [Vicinamibacteria bacterium]|nr:MFS transporter [Vicinamibacteria bacterium]